VQADGVQIIIIDSSPDSWVTMGGSSSTLVIGTLFGRRFGGG
jgi:hypothetical protein